MDQKMRLVTRYDFDGLACAMMLKELSLIDDIKFVHPKDVQDGKVELSENDITTNLPYDPRVSIAFDHHESEVDRLKAEEVGGKLIIDPNARSAARVVYDYYGGKKRSRTQAMSLWRLSTRETAPISLSKRCFTRRAGASSLPYGPPHGARTLPQLPHIEL